jgi:hypothetical protein
MRQLSRFLVFSFIFLLLTSLFVVSTTSTVVQAIDTPSIPQFTVKLVDNSYDVAPTTSTHPYTGETTTIPGYHQTRFEIVVTIKNQPFKPSTNEKEEKYALFYAFQYKGHFEETWSAGGPKTFQSNSGYTTIGPVPSGVWDAGYQLDFRVRAVIGGGGVGFDYVYYEDGKGPYFYREVVSSDWSGVQTVTIEYGGSLTMPPLNTSSTGPSDSLTSDSNAPLVSDPPLQNPWSIFLFILIVVVCVSSVSVGIIAYRYGQRKTTQTQTQTTANL